MILVWTKRSGKKIVSGPAQAARRHGPNPLHGTETRCPVPKNQWEQNQLDFINLCWVEYIPNQLGNKVTNLFSMFF